MRSSSRMWVAALLAAAFLRGGSALECLGTRNKTVATWPPGDIPLRLGEPLDIYCDVEPGLPFDASRMRFFEMTDKGDRKQHEASVVNSTRAWLHLPNPPRQASIYYCQAKDEEARHSCHNKVVVDSAPSAVLNFTCRSHSLEYLECHWWPPRQYVATNYSLAYVLHAGETPACLVSRNGTRYSCRWDGSSEPIYRTLEKYYFFNLTSENRFGSLSQNITVDHFAVVVPNKPTNLTKMSVTSHSVLLQWQIPRDLADLSPGVYHRITYQIQNIDDLNTWRNVTMTNLIRTNHTKYRFNLTDLPYANIKYDVRVFIRSIKANDTEEFWSAPEAITFTTLSERPPRPPSTHIGAFHCHKPNDNEREVYVYWQQIENYEQSGRNFTYNVIAEPDSDKKKTSRPQIISSSFAYFPNATMDGFNVSIASYNVEGNSLNRSFVYVPADSSLLKGPFGFTKTVFGNKTYDLRWRRPANLKFDSYTLFWCFNAVETVDKCTGKLNFTDLSADTDNYRIEVEEDKMYLFAISTNYGQLSSGMVWGVCNLPAEKATNKVTIFKREDVGSTYVTLRWRLECSFKPGDIKGYNVTFCSVLKKSINCNSTVERSLVIENPKQENITITNLVPHQTYRFRIAVIYKDGTGEKSEMVDATTLEDKPSKPLNLSIKNVTSNSMSVSWYPPELKNGFIVKYYINYNTDNVSIPGKQMTLTIPDKTAEEQKQEIELSELNAFTNYTVTVEACTTYCSELSDPAMVRTAIGPPVLISRQPNLNQETGALRWDPPAVPGGLIDFYEVQVLLNDEPLSTYNTTNLEQVVPLCDVSNNDNSKLEYRVRAVNLDKDLDHGIMAIKGSVIYERATQNWEGARYNGPWSESTVMHCGKNSSAILFWSLGVIMVFVFTIMLVFGSRKVWYRYKTMTDIGPVLPPGLGPIVEKEPSKYQLSSGWSPAIKTKEEKPFLPSSADKILLLPNNTLPNNKNYIGSSENTDSTTLSLTSKDLVDQEAMTSDSSNNSSLRLRNVPAKSTPVVTNASGYVGWSNQPAEPQYDDDDPQDNESTSSDDLSDSGLPSGYVQSAPLPVFQPAAINRSPPAMLGIPSGYVRAEDVNNRSPVSLPQLGLPSQPVLPDNPLMPKFLPMVAETKPTLEPSLARPRSADNIKQVVRALPLKPPVSGYVTHADAVINKHLNIISNNNLNEEPAIPDPNMSPEAYCRFAWGNDPTTNNLESLLSEQMDRRLASEEPKD